MAWKEYYLENWLKELFESMDWCTVRCDITNTVDKGVKHQTINHSIKQSAVDCFDNGYVGKQPVAWKGYCAEYWLQELQKSMDSCTCCYMTEILLKMALNTTQKKPLINLSIRCQKFQPFDFNKKMGDSFQSMITLPPPFIVLVETMSGLRHYSDTYCFYCTWVCFHFIPLRSMIHNGFL